MRIRKGYFCFVLSVLFVANVCHADEGQTLVEVFGAGECAGCGENDVKTSQAFRGLKVTIDCQPENGEFKTRGSGELDGEGNFKVSLPGDMVKDGKLKEECYARLHSSAALPCPTHGDDLESSKVVLKSESDGKHSFRLKDRLKFSPVTCASAFLPLPKFPPIYEKPFLPFYKKPFPPQVPIYKKPLLPFPPFPVYKKPLPPPIPIYKKPLPLPIPFFKKPLPPPIPVYKKPLLPPISFFKKPLPPPIPVYKKPYLPTIPFFKKPLPSPFPIYKKPLPPSFPLDEKPLIPIYKPKLPFFKPLPPLPKLAPKPKFGVFPPHLPFAPYP